MHILHSHVDNFNSKLDQVIEEYGARFYHDSATMVAKEDGTLHWGGTIESLIHTDIETLCWRAQSSVLF